MAPGLAITDGCHEPECRASILLNGSPSTTIVSEKLAGGDSRWGVSVGGRA